MAFDRKAYMKKWNAEHREYKRNKQKEYYWADPKKNRERSKKYRSTHKEKISEYNNLYSKEHREEIRKRMSSYLKEYRATHKEEHRLSSIEQRKKHPDEVKSRSIANHAIRDGKIARQPCEKCGYAKAQAHHDDYNHPLQVRWLCTRCHNEWHRNNKPTRVEKGKNESYIWNNTNSSQNNDSWVSWFW